MRKIRKKTPEGKKDGRPGGMRRPVGRTPGGVQDQIRAKILARVLGKRQELGENWKNWRLDGTANLIASRIPPGHIDWVVGGRVVFFVLIVFLFVLNDLPTSFSRPGPAECAKRLNPPTTACGECRACLKSFYASV